MTYKLNPFDHLPIYGKLDKMRINKLIAICTNKTVQLESNINSNFTMIIHKSTKVSVSFQASFFKNYTAISDIHRNTLRELLTEIYNNYQNYKITEVI